MKTGDRVKVEYEGVVRGYGTRGVLVSPDGRAPNSHLLPHSAVTAISPPEPVWELGDVALDVTDTLWRCVRTTAEGSPRLWQSLAPGSDAVWPDHVLRRPLREASIVEVVLALMACHYPERAEQLRLAVLAGLVAAK